MPLSSLIFKTFFVSVRFPPLRPLPSQNAGLVEDDAINVAHIGRCGSRPKLNHLSETRFPRCVLLLVVFLSGCGFFPLTESLESERRKTEATKEAIRNSPSLQEVNRVCESLPKTDLFRLILMRNSFRADVELLEYGYLADEPYEKVRDIFVDFFNREGWTDVYEQPGINTISVRGHKDGFSAGFTHEPVHRGVNYTLICRRIK